MPGGQVLIRNLFQVADGQRLLAVLPHGGKRAREKSEVAVIRAQSLIRAPPS